MAGDINQAKLIVRQALLADSGVTGLVSRRVYSSHMRLADARKATYPLVILEFGGGDLDAFAVVQGDSFVIWAYSRTSLDEAARVYTMVVDAIQNDRLTFGSVNMALVPWEGSRPTDGWNEKIEAWYVRAPWTLTAIG